MATPRSAPVIGALIFALGLSASMSPIASGQTITFGAPLTQAPDAPFDCIAFPLGTGALAPLAGDDSSCIWSTPSNPTEPSEGLLTPPGTGTITAIRIWAGSTTGPMSPVVLQAEKDVRTGKTTCCEATFVGQPFMPTANAINTFHTDLPVYTDPAGQESSPGLEVSDMLALAILSDGVSVPAVDETHSGLARVEEPVDEVGDPAPPLEGQAVIVKPTYGYQLDVQADWLPGVPAPSAPVLRFASGRLFVRDHAAHVALRCRKGEVCKGTVSIHSAAPAGAGGAVIYASGSFRIGRNLYRSIAVPLTADGRAAAHRGERREVMIDVAYRTPAATVRISRRASMRF